MCCSTPSSVLAVRITFSRLDFHAAKHQFRHAKTATVAKKSLRNSPKSSKQKLRLAGGNPQTAPFRDIAKAEIKIPLKKSERN